MEDQSKDSFVGRLIFKIFRKQHDNLKICIRDENNLSLIISLSLFIRSVYSISIFFS